MTNPQGGQNLDGGAVRNPFGSRIEPLDGRAASLPDAVRRCRWIAVDIGTKEFGVFRVTASTEGAALVPRFDSAYPKASAPSRVMSGPGVEEIVRHTRISSLPCWWTDRPGAQTETVLSDLKSVRRVVPPPSSGSGIAFPVYADRGQCGLVAFFGHAIALDDDSLCDIHARCFALFASISQLLPGESGHVPAVSKRETECLKLTANGLTSEQIAAALKLSVHTANQYLTNTAQKLNAGNRIQAMAKALRLGLID